MPNIITRLLLVLIIHCSASTHGNVKSITQWHKERGFDTIGYHHVILKDGTIEQGRDINKEGAHTYKHNKYSVGICLILDPTKEKPTKAQLASLTKLIWDYNLPAKPHNFYSKYKICPGKEVSAYLENLTHGKE
jgi:N-acetylmuramoyl-L-alanine amidase